MQNRIKMLELKISRVVESNKSLLQDSEIHGDLVDIMDKFDTDMNKLPQDDAKKYSGINRYIHTYICVNFDCHFNMYTIT